MYFKAVNRLFLPALISFLTALLTFSCDLDTFPHFSTSSDVNAYHIDLRSSDLRSIFAISPCAKAVTFPTRLRGFYAAVRLRRSNVGQRAG